MDFASRAFVARDFGEHEEFLSLAKLALDKEDEAASLVAGPDVEPTRSVLHRSAAALAYHCKEYRKSEILISTALAGNPPEEIANELRSLSEKVIAAMKLDVPDTRMKEQQLQYVMDGPLVSRGRAPANFVHSRVASLEKIIQRATLWLRGEAFPSRIPAQIEDDCRLFLLNYSPGSFIVELAIGRDLAVPGMSSFSDVLGKISENIELLNNGEYNELVRVFDDLHYCHNFVQLVKKISPDGKEVSSVALRMQVGGTNRSVSLNRRQSDLYVSELPPIPQSQPEWTLGDEPETVSGRLHYADARKTSEIRLIGEKRIWIIDVPPGMMHDVVQEHFGKMVEITGRPVIKKIKTQRLLLDDIKSIGEP